MPRRVFPLLGALLALLPALGPAPDGFVAEAQAEVSAEARTPAEVYERKPSIAECLVFVARDLKTRHTAAPEDGVALMLLVVDPTTSMKNEIEALRGALQAAWDEGPRGMRVGVYGIGAEEYSPPSRIPRDPDGGLSALAFIPVDGTKNIHAGIRDAADRFADEEGGPRAIVLVTEEGGEGEDDVEKTRDVLFDTGIAFYCIAGEAAFERSWIQDFEPRSDLVEAAFTERYHPEPRKRVRDELYYSGDVAFGLVPYRWELDLAQSEFYWVRPPLYPVPSGFGYWSLATLCYTSGGRYFIFDFPAATLNKRQNERRMSLYEYSRMSLVAPDLRPRSKVLKELKKDWRSQTIVKIWQHLADEKTPVIQTLGALELRGGMRVRPARPVRSTSSPRPWYEDMDHVTEAKAHVKGRIAAVEQCLKWWRSANGKERTEKPGEDPLKERVEADFQLLGVQLLKVRFQWHEALAALDTIEQLDVTYRRTRIVPRTLMTGLELPRQKVDFGSEERNAMFAEVVLAQRRLANKFPGTPWALTMQKGNIKTFQKDVRIIEPEPERPERPERPNKGDKGKPKPPPPKPPTPPAKPPAGPRPGSGSGGATTGGG